MTQRRGASAWSDPLLLAAVLGLPLAGAALAQRDLAPVFAFPPLEDIARDYPAWSWRAAALVLLPFLALAVAWQRGKRRAAAPQPPAVRAVTRRPLPPWGWLAVVWTLGWWTIAWTRFPLFGAIQRFTFFPLWLGFIISVNALTYRTRGSCGLTRAPRRWVALFAASAGFWWVFEWLNRFVHNWHYLGVEDFGPLAYAVHASLCFSTVLPAVSAVAEWIETHAAWQARWARGPAWPWFARRPTAWTLILLGAIALLLTGAFPQAFYPALWGAPLALLLGASALADEHSLAGEIATGDWRRAATWAGAALGCGFFWELWNVHSLAKWIYTVPYVDRAHVFEMPVLGYLGYLPFGLECLLVIARISGRDT